MLHKIARPSINRWLKTNRRNKAGALLLAACLIALVIGALATRPRSAHAQAPTPTATPTPTPPDYSKVDNALAGNTHLLRNDDLVVTQSYPSNNDRNNPNMNFVSSVSTANSSGTHVTVNEDGFVPPGAGTCADLGLASPCPFNYVAGDLNRPNQPATGRFFRTLQDAVVLMPALRPKNDPPSPAQMFTLMGRSAAIPGGSLATYAWTSQQNLPYDPDTANGALTVVADFNGDGYDDLLVAYSDNTRRKDGNARVRIGTAVDLDDPSKGFSFGPESNLGFREDFRQVAAADVNGDGQPELAVLRVDDGNQLVMPVFRVHPETLTVTWNDDQSYPEPDQVIVDRMQDTATRPMQLAAGSFTAATHQQLIVAAQAADAQTVKVRIFDFERGKLVPVLKRTWDTVTKATDLKMKVGRINWDSPYDQIVLMLTNTKAANDGASQVALVSVDPATYKFSEWATPPISVPRDLYNKNYNYYALDVAIGNFDNRKPSASDPSVSERNPNLQIAVAAALKNTPGSLAPALYAFSEVFILNSEDSKLKVAGGKISITPPKVGNDSAPFTNVTINPADLQGRSLRLGPGYKITVDRTAPTTVLAAPPMHADYAVPALGAKPTVLNLSVVPDAFKSEYEQENSTDTSSSNAETTSSTFSAEQSLGQSFALGKFSSSGELESGVKVTDTFTAKQDLEKSTEKKNGTFSSTEFSITQETGLNDVVWFKDSSYYLYVYEVIGRKVCPAEKPDCQESEKQPMRLMFTAPKDASVQYTASDTLEWYQPPWEYGNVLSYPATLAQLKQYIPDIALLTKENTTFATDDAGAVLKTTWTNGKTSGQSVTHKQLFTESNDLSIEGKYGFTVFGRGVKGSTEFDLNLGGSNGTESLQESESKVESSTGITISKTALFTNPFQYKYFFSPYIFGRQEPIGFTDSIQSNSDLITFGALRSAFTADPLASGAGGWWRQTYNAAPDVALNHPNRWDYVSTGTPSNGVLPSNCVSLGGGSMTGRMGCITPAEREPDNPWLDMFHDMRGFFITDARSPGEGPQKQLATVGDKLSLQTRVYNYSLKAMPAGTQVKVRFYGMEWNPELNKPADAEGKSFLIGESTLNPIAPFSDSQNAPLNWVTAGTTFDTTNYADKDLVFWVLVWMRDANGNLVQELKGKGLTGVPRSSNNEVTFSETAKLEEMVANPLGADPETISFSNNIGFYRLPVYIQPKASSLSAAAPTGLDEVKVGGVLGESGLNAVEVGGVLGGSSLDEVKVESVTAESASIKLGKAAKIHALLQNGAERVHGLTVQFYNGDPAAGGRLVDVERLAHIRAGSKHLVSIVYTPQQCGPHQIFVRVTGAGVVGATGKAAQSFQVECPTPVCAAQTCLKAAQYYALNLGGLPRGKVTIAGVSPMNQVNTSNAGQLRILLQGGNAASQKFNQQFVALQLSLLGANDPSRQTEKSNLLCYGAYFQPVQLSTGFLLNPSTTIGELLGQARIAARSGNAIDQRMLANLMQLLNGDDPSGRCK